VTSDDDRAAIAGIMRTFFAAFTSGAGCDARLDALRQVFLPEAVIVRTGGGVPAVYGVDDFIAPRRELLTNGTLTGFREWEVSGRTEIFGDVAQHFCSYAKAGVQHGAAFTGRGMKTVQFMENAELAPVLRQLIARSALPLRAIETDYAIDSSGFGSCRTETWIDQKYGTPRRRSVWVKAHVASGVKTNVVTAVRVLDKDSGDSPQLIPLVTDTADAGFTIGEISADKAYGSYANFEAVAGFGGAAFIAFKEKTTAERGGVFEKMFHYFSYKRDEYLTHYHKRSNVESTFSMIKRKFGGEVRSRTDAAMVNEVYCKLIAHNLCVLNQEQHELGIAAEFRPAPRATGARPA